jgi:hypothetical protein
MLSSEMTPVLEDGPIASVVSGDAITCAMAVAATAIARSPSCRLLMIKILQGGQDRMRLRCPLSRLLPEEPPRRSEAR